MREEDDRKENIALRWNQGEFVLENTACCDVWGSLASTFYVHSMPGCFVQTQLSFLKNLDKLIRNGQGIEMVALLRIAPLPKGPTNYFLGTTSCTWRDFIIGKRACSQ